MGHGTETGHEVLGWAMRASGWDRSHQDGTGRDQEWAWGTRTGHEELGWERRWDRKSHEGTGGDRM